MKTKLKDLRQRLNLQIKDVADLLGAPYRTVQNWDNGTRKPPPWLEKIIIEKLMAVKK